MRSAWMELRRTAADALHTFILAPQRSGVGLLTDLLRMGPRGWAWLLLLFATLGTAFVFTLPGVGPQVRDGLAHPAGIGLLTLWIAFLWTADGDGGGSAGGLPAAGRGLWPVLLRPAAVGRGLAAGAGADAGPSPVRADPSPLRPRGLARADPVGAGPGPVPAPSDPSLLAQPGAQGAAGDRADEPSLLALGADPPDGAGGACWPWA